MRHSFISCLMVLGRLYVNPDILETFLSLTLISNKVKTSWYRPRFPSSTLLERSIDQGVTVGMIVYAGWVPSGTARRGANKLGKRGNTKLYPAGDVQGYTITCLRQTKTGSWFVVADSSVYKWKVTFEQSQIQRWHGYRTRTGDSDRERLAWHILTLH